MYSCNRYLPSSFYGPGGLRGRGERGGEERLEWGEGLVTEGIEERGLVFTNKRKGRAEGLSRVVRRPGLHFRTNHSRRRMGRCKRRHEKSSKWSREKKGASRQAVAGRVDRGAQTPD